MDLPSLIADAPNRLSGRVQSPQELTSAERAQMYPLLAQYFANVSPPQFEHDLAEKEWVILLTDTITGQIQGFSTLMRLRVTVPNHDRLLKPEMFAAVRVYVASTPDALTVPLAAVQNSSTGKMVFVQRGTNDFEVRMVKVGSEQGEGVTVLEGVSAGEQVVTKGSFVLKSELERHKIEPTP